MTRFKCFLCVQSILFFASNQYANICFFEIRVLKFYDLSVQSAKNINQSRTNGPINAHLTIVQVMPKYNHNNEKQEALL